MASPRVSAPLWDTDGVLVGGTRWKPVSSVRLQRYGFEFDALVRELNRAAVVPYVEPEAVAYFYRTLDDADPNARFDDDAR